MHPQRDPFAPQSGNEQESTNPSGPAPGSSFADLSNLSKEAADTPAVATPLAGQTITPGVSQQETPKPSAPFSPANDTFGTFGSNANAAGPTQPFGSSMPPAGMSSPNALETPQQSAPQPDLVTPPSGAPANSPLAPSSAGKRRRKGLFIGLIVAAVILLLSGGVAAGYFGYYLPNKPENVLKKALANAFSPGKVKTMHFSGEMIITSEGDDVDFKATYSGQIDNTSGAFLFSGNTDVLLTNLALEARSTDGKSLYIKASGLDGLPEVLDTDPVAKAFAPLARQINNRWIEITEGFMKESLGNSFEGFKLSGSDLNKLAAAYEQNQFIVIKEVLPDETIAGVRSYHYRVAYDTAKLRSFVRAVQDAKLDILVLTSDQVEAFIKTLDKDDYWSRPWDIWIGRGDKMIRQATFEDTEEGMTARLRFMVENYNQPVRVEKPENTMSILELINVYFETFFGNPTSFQSDLETFFMLEEESTEVPNTGISL